MPARRSLLSSAAVGLSIAVAGCSTFIAADPEAEPQEIVDDWQDDPARGTAASITFERSLDEPDDLETKCYTIAKQQLDTALADHIDEQDSLSTSLTTRTGTDRLGIDAEGRVLVVARQLVVSRSGTVHSTPTVAFETVREQVPHTVHGTVGRDDDGDDTTEQTCRVPVYLRDERVQEDSY